MSASQTPPGPTGGDPSMEDILASIRRILSEDDAPAADANPQPAHTASDGVVVLDPAMIVPESGPEEPALATQPRPAVEPRPPAEPRPAAEPRPTLVEPETAAAAATSVGNLVRTLTERSAQVRSGGPTIEEIVREEIRPLLKEWLNANLPTLVERLVRAEIERVVGRAVP